MNDEQRRELGDRIKARRLTRFGSKSDAYRQAGVNAATWDKAEAGESMRDDRLAAVVRALWPDSEGDWRAIDGRASSSVGAAADDGMSQWLTRTGSELTDEEVEELWRESLPVLEAFKAKLLSERRRGSRLGDT